MKTARQKTIAAALAALAALLMLAAAGCGGGGDTTEAAPATTTEEPAALSKEEVISQGDAICAEVNAAVGALGASEAAEGASGDEKFANLYVGMVESLQDLGTPQGDDGSYVKFSEAAERLAMVEGEVKLAAEREDLVALEEASTESEPALEEFQSQAAIYGFEDCSEGPSALTPGAGAAAPEAGGEESEGGFEEEGGVESEPEYVEPEVEEEVAPEEAPQTGGAGGGEIAPEAAPETGGGSESGGIGPG